MERGHNSDLSNELKEWVGNHRRELVRRAYGLLGDWELSEDVVQETLLKVLTGSSEMRIRELDRYLAKAVFWNALKVRGRRRMHLSLDEIDARILEQSLSSLEDGSIDPFELEEAIEDLPLPQQTAIRLKVYLGLSFREIGQRLSISANTVASRCRYALKGLHRRFMR